LLSVALYEPEIPGNAGNIARLCAATGTPLHLIGRLGFSFSHPAAKRAVMDYWERVDMHRHVTFGEFRDSIGDRPLWMLSTRGQRGLWQADLEPDAVLLFGPESRGLPPDLLAIDPARTIRIPMLPDARSLNLANAVGITLYEALRRTGWSPPERDGSGPPAGDPAC
jgi:tRNA (cytidine/uridine-2'-O-)-methyltransferase